MLTTDDPLFSEFDDKNHNKGKARLVLKEM